MSDNKSFRATVSYLIVRDLAHEKVFAKALESLGVDWDKSFPYQRPTVQKCRKLRNLKKEICIINSGPFRTKDWVSLVIFAGPSPFGDGELEALDGLPEGFDIPQMPEAPQEYAPGLDKDLKKKTKLEV